MITVLHGDARDPFGGSGTTGIVADRLGRNAVIDRPQSEVYRDGAGSFAG